MHPEIENANLEPPEPRWLWVRGLPVAVLAHVALIVALTWGVQWKSQPDAVSAIPLPPDTAAMGAGAGPAEAGPAVEETGRVGPGPIPQRNERIVPAR